MDTAAFVGVLTAMPMLYVAFFMCVAMGAILPERGRGNQVPVVFQFLILGHMFQMLLIGGLLIYYISYLFKTPLVPNDKKSLWAIVLFMGNVIAMPVFWYHHVWTPARNANR